MSNFLGIINVQYFKSLFKEEAEIRDLEKLDEFIRIKVHRHC